MLCLGFILGIGTIKWLEIKLIFVWRFGFVNLWMNGWRKCIENLFLVNYWCNSVIKLFVPDELWRRDSGRQIWVLWAIHTPACVDSTSTAKWSMEWLSISKYFVEQHCWSEVCTVLCTLYKVQKTTFLPFPIYDEAALDNLFFTSWDSWFYLEKIVPERLYKINFNLYSTLVVYILKRFDQLLGLV